MTFLLQIVSRLTHARIPEAAVVHCRAPIVAPVLHQLMAQNVKVSCMLRAYTCILKALSLLNSLIGRFQSPHNDSKVVYLLE